MHVDSCTGSTGSQRSLGALEERSVVIVVEMYDSVSDRPPHA